MKNIGKEIDVTKIDLEKESEKIATLPGLMDFAHTMGGALIKPEDKGKIKGQAVAAMHEQTNRQFQQIYKQFQVLADQANELKKRVEVSERIYKSDIGFKPVYNEVYYLYYNTETCKDILSMVAPNEWGRTKPPYTLISSVKFLADHTWEVIN